MKVGNSVIHQSLGRIRSLVHLELSRSAEPFVYSSVLSYVRWSVNSSVFNSVRNQIKLKL